MITPLTAKCNAFSHLQEKYKKLMEEVDKLITGASNEGEFKIVIDLDSYSYEELMKIKKLFEHEGYIVYTKCSGKDGLVIQW